VKKAGLKHFHDKLAVWCSLVPLAGA